MFFFLLAVLLVCPLPSAVVLREPAICSLASVARILLHPAGSRLDQLPHSGLWRELAVRGTEGSLVRTAVRFTSKTTGPST